MRTLSCYTRNTTQIRRAWLSSDINANSDRQAARRFSHSCDGVNEGREHKGFIQVAEMIPVTQDFIRNSLF